MKKFLLLLSLVLSCMAVSVCPVKAGNPAEAGDSGVSKWTVMFYMCGSDLESKYGYASGNLVEIANTHDLATLFRSQAEKLGIESQEPLREVNVVLQTGGCREWHNMEKTARTTDTQIRTDVLQRWHYDPYEDVSTAEIRLQQEVPLASMSDPETLSDFIRWSVEEYPAEKYMLVLWDHGGGSRTGIFVDELYDGDILYLYELGQALEECGVMIDTVLFDACMMANLETACMIKDHARWMIASEEVVTGEGTAIGEWMKELCTRPDMDGSKLGRIICDSSQEKCAMLGDEQGAQLLTWSVIDLSRIDELADQMEKVMMFTAETYKENPEMVSYYMKQRNLAEKYGNREDKMTDLYNVILLSPTLYEEGIAARNSLLEALEDCVVYCVRGSGRVMARGLSFCFGVEMTEEELDIFARNCPSPAYLSILDAITPWEAPEELYEKVERLPDINDMEEYDIIVERSIGENGMPGIRIAGNDYNINAINCAYYRLDEETGNVVLMGYIPTTETSAADGRTQHVSIVEPWNWPCAGSELCCIALIENVYGESLYEIPVQVNSDIWRFRCGYSPEKGYEIYGVWEGYNSSSNLFNRNVVSLSSMAGQTYRLLYPILDMATDLQGGEYEYSEPQTITRVLPVETRPLPPGTYYIEYVVEDMFMRRIPMERVGVKWDGENMSLAENAVWEGKATLRWSKKTS